MADIVAHQTDEITAHPVWCDPQWCEVVLDLPLAEHRSAPVVITEAHPPLVRAWLAQGTSEPPNEAKPYLIIRWSETDHRGDASDASTLWLGIGRAHRLHAVIGDLIAMAES